MYHNLAETKLFYQAPGYLSAHLESFWRSSALPQIFKLEIFESFVSKKKKKAKYQARPFISEFSWMRANWACSFLHQWLWFRYLEIQLVFSAGSEAFCKTQIKIYIYVPQLPLTKKRRQQPLHSSDHGKDTQILEPHKWPWVWIEL